MSDHIISDLLLARNLRIGTGEFIMNQPSENYVSLVLLLKSRLQDVRENMVTCAYDVQKESSPELRTRLNMAYNIYAEEEKFLIKLLEEIPIN